ncbi:hypothetical protein HPB51_014927 [Rhipicephalus microplus]|uniref:Uncharacterized protein n=1 Tax=Rhipicephalus microplus TaxID=6941 RepID=A0A9J6EGY5_RHIMP|nr:hypothetical protein HPB51_014927 [Rhipicephalus microplus]
MNAAFVALLLCACAAAVLAGDLGHYGGFGGFGGYGGYGGYDEGHSYGYHKTVPGPSFLVKTVHHVNKLHQGAHLVETCATEAEAKRRRREDPGVGAASSKIFPPLMCKNIPCLSFVTQHTDRTTSRGTYMELVFENQELVQQVERTSTVHSLHRATAEDLGICSSNGHTQELDERQNDDVAIDYDAKLTGEQEEYRN